MQLPIGKRIKSLRQERSLTQEELAAHLGISFQSISKWERGDGYPDITMLPALARYFHISVDELLGMDELNKSEEYQKTNQQWEANRQMGLHAENIQLMKEALKLFPNDALLLVQLSSSLERLDGTPEEKQRYLQESIAVQEQILQYTADSEVRGATLYNICFSYWKNGERGKALEHAHKVANLYKARENLLVHFLEGAERQKVAKEALVPLAWSLSLHLSVLAEEDASCQEKAEIILDLLCDVSDHAELRAIRDKLKKKH